ncbi:MAG: hypothetical protein WC002_00530 [Candidatus Muiribacteriota bacterium]|jgi:hypothetical protein
MKKIIIILILSAVFQIYSMPAYKADGEKILITTFFPGTIFEFISGTGEINSTVRQNRQEFNKLVNEFRITENLSVGEFPINAFFAGVAGASFDFVNSFDPSNRNTNFFNNVLIPAKHRYLKEYIDSFKNGYEQTSVFMKKINNNENFINAVFFKPVYSQGSVEERANFRGYNISINFFDTFHNNIRRTPLESASMKDFIINYAYSLGMISYMKMYYGSN